MKLKFISSEIMEFIKLDDYIGKHCQIVSKIVEVKSEYEEVYYDFGIIKEVNHQEGFIIINTPSGFINKKFEDIYDILPIENEF
jgi:ribosomal protein S8